MQFPAFCRWTGYVYRSSRAGCRNLTGRLIAGDGSAFFISGSILRVRALCVRMAMDQRVIRPCGRVPPFRSYFCLLRYGRPISFLRLAFFVSAWFIDQGGGEGAVIFLFLGCGMTGCTLVSFLSFSCSDR